MSHWHQVLHVTPPDAYRDNEDHIQSKDPCALPSVQAIDHVMTWEMSDSIAAVIMEPIITGGGVIMPHDSYLQGVKAVCEAWRTTHCR